jgi:hypothetical protein
VDGYAAGRAELLGHWSVEHGFHSAMEDEWLLFRPDGTGRYEYLRPWYRERIDFRWRLVGDALMHVEPYLHTVHDEWDDPPRLEQHAVGPGETVGYAVAVNERPLLEQPVRELSVELPFALRAPFAFVRSEEPETDVGTSGR